MRQSPRPRVQTLPESLWWNGINGSLGGGKNLVRTLGGESGRPQAHS